MLSPRSPGGEFPSFTATERKSPTTIYAERRSPTSNIQVQGSRSPIGFYEPDRRSPTSTVHVQDRRSPVGFLDDIEEGRRSPTMQVQGRRSPIGFSQGLITCIPIASPSAGDISPMAFSLQIPPITVSNPSETCAIIEKSVQSTSRDAFALDMMCEKPASPVQERKERSVIRDIMAFVRKPSKKVTSPPVANVPTSRTGRFAAAFSRAESGSGTPLLRQSTFSTSPAASSRAGKSAVTKQMSDVGCESKISFKLLNSKMSLRLRRALPDDGRNKGRKSSGDDMSDMESSDSKAERGYGDSSSPSTTTGQGFELENVRFDKVGESYIKHDKIREETLEDNSPSPVKQAVDYSESVMLLHNTECDSDDDDFETGARVKLLQSQLGHLMATSDSSLKSLLPDQTQTGALNIQCPTFEIMPPSRRASFDPPRSPYLDQLRSSCDTDSELMLFNRIDSGGDSFELVDTDKNRESSFESRYPSSSHTSFDISRYQSTSYDDQTSSFELVDLETQRSSIDEKRSSVDLRKSSIEMVDIDAFQRAEVAGRKSSLETHFDYQSPATGLNSLLKSKRQVSEPNRGREYSPSLTMKTHYSAPNRARSPLSAQTSSNFSSRDSYDSSFEPVHTSPRISKSPFSDKGRQHFPLAVTPNMPTDSRSFLCTDQRCSSIFEPRPGRSDSLTVGPPSSSSEFEPPSPRRAASASPKHTFTFRIVLKKMDSSPDAICPSAERRRSRERNERLRRRDSRKKRLMDVGKSF